MLAARALGADGVQIGSRFVASEESSAHENFKKAVLAVHEGDTELTLKEITPVRLIKNKFYEELQKLYRTCPTDEELRRLLGRGRAKRGMFEGDLEEGELEIGQVAALFDEVLPAGRIVQRIIDEYRRARQRLCSED
jgi:enoyl-[acyl-carrier protein] reductase II